MAKKKVTIEETSVSEVEATALPEITDDNAAEVKEAPAKTKRKSTRKSKTIEVLADEVDAVADDGEITSLTDIAPELSGETVVVDAVEAKINASEVAKSFIDDVSAVEDILPDKIEADAPAKLNAKKSKQAKKYHIEEPVWCYPSSVAPKSVTTICGDVYLWDDTMVTGRYAVTCDPDGAGKLKALSGWVDAKDLGL